MSKMLKSMFKFGFELEGIYDGSRYESNDSVAEYLDDVLNTAGNLHRDGSLRAGKIERGVPFEYSTDVFDYTPKNVNNVIHFMDGMNKNGIYTNRTCGFHTHISYPSISRTDVVWFIFYMCATGRMEEFYKLTKSINLFNRSYANKDCFELIRKYILLNKPSSALGYIVSNDKYRSIRIHPQGTIEWRGPRTFLNKPTHKKNITFFKKLDKMISYFVESMNSDVVYVNREGEEPLIYYKTDIINMAKERFTFFAFKERIKKKTFYESVFASPEILNKMSYKLLIKNSDDVIKLLDNLCYNNYTYTSEKLFKFVIDVLNNKDNQQPKFQNIEKVIKLFNVSLIKSNYDVLYKNGLLSKFLVESFRKNDMSVIRDMIEFIKHKKYVNSIILTLETLKEKNNSFAMQVIIELLKYGLEDVCNVDEKTKLLKIIEYIKARPYGFEYDNGMLASEILSIEYDGKY